MSRSAKICAAVVCSLLLAGAIQLRAGGTSTGKTPLNDLGSGTYQGFQGGLYPGGANQPPAGHAADALQLASEVVPRDASGQASDDGWIAMVSIGMSNNTHSYSVFERQEDKNAERNARLVLLNGSVGDQNAGVIDDPNASYWQTVQQRLVAMDLTAAQVQVAWLKNANSGPPNDFPGHALDLETNLRAIVRNLQDKFPRLRLCYVSSRSYGGYATIDLNPEPQAYEAGFSFRWLIEDQIDGDADLNYDAAQGVVEAPLLLWGPYLWADGLIPRSDGLIWTQENFQSDGTHPSPSGEQKVADLLSAFFAAEPSAQPWYAARQGPTLLTLDATDDASVRADSPGQNFGTLPQLLTQGSPNIPVYLRFDLRDVPRPVLRAKLSLRVQQGMGVVRTVSLVPDSAWDEATITFANAPSIAPGGLRTVPPVTEDSSIAADLTQAVNADADGILSFAIRTISPQPGSYFSKEAGQAPRLVLVLAQPASTPALTRGFRGLLIVGLLLGLAVLARMRPRVDRS